MRPGLNAPATAASPSPMYHPVSATAAAASGSPRRARATTSSIVGACASPTAAHSVDVAAHRGGVARERLPAPLLPAHARRPVRVDRHVPEFPGGVRLAAQ